MSRVVLCWLAVTVLTLTVVTSTPPVMYIIEESPVHTYVGSVAPYFTRQHPDASHARFRYGFLSQPHQDASLFQLDDREGVLRTARVIDREDYCPGEAECFVDIDIALTEPIQLLTVETFRISISDINDQPPRFPEPEYPVSFSELSPFDTRVSLPVALDDDSPANGVVPESYELVGGRGQFVLSSSPLSGDLYLVLKAALDRETKEEYEVRVRAYDAGQRVGSLRVPITVEDANDHAPVFENTSYIVDVKENYPLNVGFFVAVASDNDAGDNGRVSYKFAARTHGMFRRQFGIGESTGDVYLKSELDWARRREYRLDIVAEDHGPRPRAAQCSLTVRVIDVNDHPPVVSINTLSNSSVASVAENSPEHTFVAFVSVFDSDDGRNGQVTCSLNHDEFRLQGGSADKKYQLQTARELDRELVQFYDLRIACRDLGEPSLSSVGNLTVVVLDENDHRPTFLKSSYRVAFLENNQPDELIVRVNASDPDKGANGRLFYEIVQPLTQYVYIQRDSGDILASDVLDRERLPQLTFTVRVRDHGNPPLTSSVNVTIVILDENDNAPVFSKKTPFTFQIRENLNAHAYVGRVNASDDDSEEFNQFNYSLVQADTPGAFTINEVTGEISSTKVLDREVRDQYFLTAIVRDVDRPALSSTALVVINVVDDNDNFPQFKYPSLGNNTFHISNLLPAGRTVFKATAVDLDAQHNARVSYEISPGADPAPFTIDPTTGDFSTITDFTDVVYAKYDLKLVAVDSGRPSLNQSIEIIVVVDANTPYHPDQHAGHGLVRNNNNLLIIIAVASVSAFIMVVLIIAIAAMKCRDRRRPTGVYKCRAEEQKILRQVAVMEGSLSRDSLRSAGSNNSRRTSPPASTDQKLVKRDPDGRAGNGDVTTWNAAPGLDETSCALNAGHEQHLEAHLLALLRKDRGDSESSSSAEVSTADSGRGASEEGDHSGAHTLPRHGHVHGHNYSTKTLGPGLKSYPTPQPRTDRPRQPDSLVTTPTTPGSQPPPGGLVPGGPVPGQRAVPPLRGSLHYLVKEEEDRRGRHQRKTSSNPKQSLTTFQANPSPPSYESCVGEKAPSPPPPENNIYENTNFHANDISQSQALLQNGLQNIAEEEDCSDVSCDSIGRRRRRLEHDGRFVNKVGV